MGDLSIETRTKDGTDYVSLSGEFDLAGVRKFEDALAKVESTRPSVVVVDLSGLDFMDSSGLRAIVLADQRARRNGCRFAIVPGPPMVRRVFEITQLDERLDLVENGSAV